MKLHELQPAAGSTTSPSVWAGAQGRVWARPPAKGTKAKTPVPAAAYVPVLKADKCL